MNTKHEINITPRDRLLMGWEDSMELVRDFEIYSQEVREDKEASALFAKFAEDEADHAAKFRSLLEQY